MKKKIAILTLPLHCNYGGNIQLYALMSTLRKLGYSPCCIDRGWDHLKPAFKELLIARLKFVLSELWNGKSKRLKVRDDEDIYCHSKLFIRQYIRPRTFKIYSSNELSKLEKKYDAFVFGSDQIWRKGYSSNVMDYFGGFLKHDDTLCLSYAASFGIDGNEFSENEIERIRICLQRFRAVSVREKEAISLLNKNGWALNKEVVQLIDPTMLLSIQDYRLLYSDRRSNGEVKDAALFYYILDMDETKQDIINRVLTRKELHGFTVSPSDANPVYPPIELWLKAFDDTSFVVTDSFHGCVFSILFNKPFLAMGNEKRGLSRFISLLELFGLRNRLVYSWDESNNILDDEIDWASVNKILEEKKKVALDFITRFLG